MTTRNISSETQRKLNRQMVLLNGLLSQSMSLPSPPRHGRSPEPPGTILVNGDSVN